MAIAYKCVDIAMLYFQIKTPDMGGYGTRTDFAMAVIKNLPTLV